MSSARWTTRDGRRALAVTPTAALRQWVSREGADAAWLEIVAQLPDADKPGMHDQLTCHVLFVPDKKRFYLEPWRPAVGYTETVAAQCNPGGVPDSDQL